MLPEKSKWRLIVGAKLLYEIVCPSVTYSVTYSLTFVFVCLISYINIATMSNGIEFLFHFHLFILKLYKKHKNKARRWYWLTFFSREDGSRVYWPEYVTYHEASESIFSRLQIRGFSGHMRKRIKKNLGSESGSESRSESGSESGSELGSESGSEPGSESGSESRSESG